KQQKAEGAAAADAESAGCVIPAAAAAAVEAPASASGIVLEYCTAVRGILNDDQGGPLQPPGLRMADALSEVRDSLERNLAEKKGASPRRNSVACATASIAASTPSAPNKRNCVAT